MNTIVCKLCVLAVLVGAMGVGVADGQIATSLTFKAPSSFVAGDATFPAGSYVITPSETREDMSTLQISSADEFHSALVETRAGAGKSETPAKSTHLVFRKYGDLLCLHRIALRDQTYAYVVITGNAEKEAAKAGPPTEQTVEGTLK